MTNNSFINNKMFGRSDTIAAISTPHGRGGIGIIRISGSNAIQVVMSILSTKIDISALQSEKSRKIFYAILRDHDQNKIDEILVSFLPEDRSYTGECTFELNCHGGKAIMAYAMEAVLHAGARMAEPGEFSRRAVESGRMNLVQAEAVNEIIHARTKRAIHAAWKQMDGALTDKCNDLKIKMIDVITGMQATVDFEIDGEKNQWLERLREIDIHLSDILLSAEKGRYLTHGCWVVLTGPPNAGKSSIFNSILNIERALVSNIPGTTRDHISETLEIEGIEVKLTDTAGIRNSEDEIERASIQKSESQARAADILLLVLDHSIEISEEERIRAEEILNQGGFVLLNKYDLAAHPSIKNAFESTKRPENIIPISVISKYGLDNFLNRLAEVIDDRVFNQENPVITSVRQTKILMKARSSIFNAIMILEKGKHDDTAMYELNLAMNSLDEIIGEVTNEEILDEVFSKFCIGK